MSKPEPKNIEIIEHYKELNEQLDLILIRFKEKRKKQLEMQ